MKIVIPYAVFNTKITRGWFNLIIAAASIPVSYLQYLQMEPLLEKTIQSAMRTGQIPDVSYTQPWWIDGISAIIFLLMVPVIMGRIKDVNWPMWVLALAYSGAVFDTIASLAGGSAPWFVGLPSFIIISALCMKKSYQKQVF